METQKQVHCTASNSYGTTGTHQNLLQDLSKSITRLEKIIHGTKHRNRDMWWFVIRQAKQENTQQLNITQTIKELRWYVVSYDIIDPIEEDRTCGIMKITVKEKVNPSFFLKKRWISINACWQWHGVLLRWGTQLDKMCQMGLKPFLVQTCWLEASTATWSRCWVGLLLLRSPVLRWMCDSPWTGCAWRITSIYMWHKQAIIEWLWHVISIVACCHSVKFCALAAQAFQLQHFQLCAECYSLPLSIRNGCLLLLSPLLFLVY